MSSSTHSSRLTLILVVVSGAAFLDFLDVTVVNLAFPDLASDFEGPPVSDLAWVITGYSVIFAALLTPAGRLADVLGRRRVFLAGTALFTLASLGSALAPSLGALVGARLMQGAAAALTLPAGLGIVLAESPPERRAAAVGIWGAATATAAIVGPTVGGVLVDTAGWRAVFLINLPFGLLILFGALRLVRPAPARSDRLPDLLGTLVLTAGVGLVVLGITQGTEWGWSAPATVASLTIGAALLATGLLRSRAHPAPAVETSFWRIPKFAVANGASLLFGASVYAWMLICVLFLVGVWGYSEIQAGLAMSPGALTGAVTAAVVGQRIERRGQRAAIVLGGLLLVADAFWLVLALGTDPSFLTIWLPAGLIVGVAMGAIGVGISTAAVTAVEPASYAAATGLNLTARQFGGALGVAVLAAVLQERLGDGIDPYLVVFAFCGTVALAGALLGLRLPEPDQPAATASRMVRSSRAAARKAAL
jgi:EmrB/QacA subfamily drug resistance transporter